MSETDVPSARRDADGYGSPSGATDWELADRARYEREAAAMDLADAEQADCQPLPQTDRAAELYASSDAHRRRAERLEAGDRSALLEIEPMRPTPATR